MAMGRKKSRVESSEVVSGLAPAFPASPTRPPKYVFYCNNHANGRLYVVNASALYAARKLYDRLTLDQDDVYASPLDKFTMCFGDVDIRCEQLAEVLAHKYTKEEEEWPLPSPYPNEIHLFLHGPTMGKAKLESTTAPGKLVSAAPKAKVDRTGKTSIQDLCAQLNIEPRDARAALRKAKVEKPSGGWLFAADQIEAIIKIIKGKK
jgi:hypothetical protein